MTRRERRKLFLDQVRAAIGGDLAAIEQVLKLDQQSTPEDEQKPVKIVFKVSRHTPDDDQGVTVEEGPAELPPGQAQLLLTASEQKLLESAPDREESADAPEPAEQSAPTVVVEQRRAPSCFEDLSDAERERFAADGWRTCPDFLRPRSEGVSEDYENTGFGDGRLRGRASYDMGIFGPNSVHGRR